MIAPLRRGHRMREHRGTPDAPAFAASPDIEVVAVAQPRPGQGTAGRGHLRLPCASTGTRSSWHGTTSMPSTCRCPQPCDPRWVEAALRTNKHVLAEKPVSTEYACTRDLFELAASRGLGVMENVMFVHHRSARSRAAPARRRGTGRTALVPRGVHHPAARGQ
ncbi:Gfo/Idh/MocA family oxidoreductase [Streptomyces sp. KL116D]|uniref:Gfo/Idh/MocA family oxidoreductase n=1 Tax=Streptomyces sp. KL116D TaxID=3045152 RepID=UPI003557816D